MTDSTMSEWQRLLPPEAEDGGPAYNLSGSLKKKRGSCTMTIQVEGISVAIRN